MSAGSRCFASNSIVWGFLLYLALERRRAARARRRLRPMALWACCSRCLRSQFPSSSPSRSWPSSGDASAQRAFPYVSAAFGMILVGVLWRAEGLFRNRVVRGASFYLGRISYSVYLFHLIVIMALKPMHRLSAARAATRRSTCSRSWRCRPSSSPGSSGRSWRRGPITARRGARPRRRRAARRTSPLASLAARRCAWPCGACRRRARPQRLHGRQALCVLSAPCRDGASRPCACGHERARIRPARSLSRRAPSFCSRSRCRSRTLSTAARPDCRWSRRSRRRPIPIAPRTPIRPRSRPGGSIISTSGSGTTG